MFYFQQMFQTVLAGIDSGPIMGIVLNIASKRLFYFPAMPEGQPTVVKTYPIGIGRVGWETPIGTTTVTAKARDPHWYVPWSVQQEHAELGEPLPSIIPPGPDNPLGSRWLSLGTSSYGIHGTNIRWSIGRLATHGCIRLYPEDIAQLFPRIKPGIPVNVVAQEAKIGQRDGQLLLEIHPDPQQSDEMEAGKALTPAKIPELAWRITQAAGKDAPRIDWDAVHRAEAERAGVPIPILKPGKAASADD